MAPLKNESTIEELMKRQQDLDMQMGFSLFVCDINFEFSKAAGLGLVDKKVKPNERYIYKVTIADQQKSKMVGDGLISISPSQTQILKKPTIQKVQFGNLLASVSWDVKNEKGIYSAYYLERSTNGKNFKRLSELPTIAGSEKPSMSKFAYEDSLSDNNTTYYYRIMGITPFGVIGPASEIVSGHGVEGFELLPKIIAGKGDNTKMKAEIMWVFPKEREADLLGFQVLRADNIDGPYNEINRKLMSKFDTSYVDLEPKSTNYYKIKALGKEGQIATSFPYLIKLYDAVPPKVPTGIKGKINDSGVVVLVWRQNKDDDLLGYRVFKANNLKEDFIELSRDFVTRNSFNDTVSLNTLTEEVYYRISAVDQNFNNSEFSEPFLLKKPDLVPPAKPLLTNYRLENGVLKMEWIPSVSEVVEKYQLQRVEKNTYEAVEILSWTPKKPISFQTIIDSNAIIGKSYYYQLIATDDAGNSSFNRTGEIEYETGIRKPITDIKASVDFKERRVYLAWSYDKNYEVERYIIYRCKKGEPMEIYTTMLGNKTFLEEKNLPIGNFYQYQIKGEIKGGIKTQISKIVEVKY